MHKTDLLQIVLYVPLCGANPKHMRVGKWIKRLGVWGFLFFLVKGLLWLLIPALVAFWASS